MEILRPARQPTATRPEPGFTLVEFAIVLIVLGVLIGGILKGQTMVNSARIRNIESDHTRISTAIRAYEERYGELPGDDPVASTRFDGAWTPGDDGNGDGRIEGEWNSTYNASESRRIWKHLRGAGLIKGPVEASESSYEQPGHAFGGSIGYQRGLHNLSGNVTVFGGISGDIARMLEARSDDGGPASGNMQGHADQAAYEASGIYDLAVKN